MTTSPLLLSLCLSLSLGTHPHAGNHWSPPPQHMTKLWRSCAKRSFSTAKETNSVKRQSNNNIKFCSVASSTTSSTESSNQQYLLTFSCHFSNNKVAKLWWNILLTHVSGNNNKIDAVSRSSQLSPSHHAWFMLLTYTKFLAVYTS